jgi:radical SAM-linked protein
MVHRVRIRFRKQEALRLTSHRDVMRMVERLFRRAEIAVCESEGFHPKPRVHYPASLALGMTGIDEVLEADLPEEIDGGELLSRLNAHSVPGLEFATVETLPPQGKKGQPQYLRFEISLSPERTAQLREPVAAFNAATTWNVDREGRQIDIRPLVAELTLAEHLLAMRLRVVNEAGARPRDVLEVLGFSADETLELEMVRTQVEMSA